MKTEREQDEVQSGIGDLGLAGRHLRLDDRWPRPSRPLHQREQRGTHQPDPRSAHRILSGELTRYFSLDIRLLDTFETGIASQF